MCEALEAVSRGEIKRLIINIPPGLMKSLLVSVFWPAWEWLSNPGLRVQCLSSSDYNVVRDAGKMRDILLSEWYRELSAAISAAGNAPTWRFGPKAAEKNFVNTETGYRQSITIGSLITGARAYRQIIDDPHDAEAVLGTPEQAEAKLGKTIDRVEGVLASRIEAPGDGEASYVLIMQRLHDNDLTAYWLKTYPDETVHICLPMHFDQDHPFRCEHDPRIEEGELLHPAFMDEAEVERKARALQRKGSQVYAQHEQRPRPATGTLYRAEDWNVYEVHPLDLVLDDEWMSIDPNVKETKHGSYFCAHVWGRKFRSSGHGPSRLAFNRYLLDRYSARVDHDEAFEAVKRLRYAHPNVKGIVIEDKANGPALASMLRGLFPGVVLYPRVSTQSKEVFNQVNGVPPCRAGEVFLPLPEYAPWVHEVRERVERFPATPNDDADTMAIMFAHWSADAVDGSGFTRNVNAFGFLG